MPGGYGRPAMPDLYPAVATAELPTDGVPIGAAATILLLADRPDLQVLALRRTTRSTFVADHTVFPGGAIDPGDHDPRWSGLVDGLTSDAADRGLMVDGGGLGHWIAAVRETIEEVGVLLGTGDRSLLDRRRDLDRGRASFVDLVGAGGRLDLAGIHPVSRWVTPMPSPKRYDTYFFVAAAPDDAEPVADGHEAVSVDWWRPADALDAWRVGGLTMISPTISMLQRLAGYSSTAEVLAAATSGAPRETVRILDESQDPVLFPGDPGYDAPGTREAMGWVWLPAAGAPPPGCGVGADGS